MRLLGLDFESTGLDVTKDRIIEIGAVLWDVADKRPLTTVSIFTWDESYPAITDEITNITGIRDEHLKELGTPFAPNIQCIEKLCRDHRVDFVVAHNGTSFDRPLLLAELSRTGAQAPLLCSLPWLDTRTDIPFASEPDSRKLKHLALDAGFINPFAHRAVFDTLSMMRILSNYDINAVIAYSKIPFITVRAMVSFDDRQKAKDARFSWERVGDTYVPKSWIKRIKENQFEAECKKCSFQVIQVE